MKVSRLADGAELPLVIEPDAGEESAAQLQAWAEAERAWIADRLHQHGGLLLRGFAVTGAESFQEFCAGFGNASDVTG